MPSGVLLDASLDEGDRVIEGMDEGGAEVGTSRIMAGYEGTSALVGAVSTTDFLS